MGHQEKYVLFPAAFVLLPAGAAVHPQDCFSPGTLALDQQAYMARVRQP